MKCRIRYSSSLGLMRLRECGAPRFAMGNAIPSTKLKQETKEGDIVLNARRGNWG